MMRYRDHLASWIALMSVKLLLVISVMMLILLELFFKDHFL